MAFHGKKRPLRNALLFASLLCAVVAWLAFGERGFIYLYRMETERQSYSDKVRLLAKENEALLEEIRRLRSDPRYLEAVVRRELGLIKGNEVIYRSDHHSSMDGNGKGLVRAQQSGQP